MRNELDQSTLNDQILKTPVCVFLFVLKWKCTNYTV